MRVTASLVGLMVSSSYGYGIGASFLKERMNMPSDSSSSISSCTDFSGEYEGQCGASKSELTIEQKNCSTFKIDGTSFRLNSTKSNNNARQSISTLISDTIHWENENSELVINTDVKFSSLVKDWSGKGESRSRLIKLGDNLVIQIGGTWKIRFDGRETIGGDSTLCQYHLIQ